MGMFKQMKDAKKALEEAPGMVEQAQQMGQQAQEMAAAQQAAAQQAAAQAAAAAAAQGGAAAAAGGNLEPIAGVSLQQFAEVTKELANHGYDQSKAASIAAAKGISAENWQQALDGWNDRIKADPSVAQQFNTFYRS